MQDKVNFNRKETIMKNIAIIFAALAIVIGMFCVICDDNNKLQKRVYAVLEQDTLSADDRDFVQFATDDREMKESTVNLDYEHRRMFKEHFGYER